MISGLDIDTAAEVGWSDFSAIESIALYEYEWSLISTEWASTVSVQ
jgi:hypothetical protein